MAMDLPADTLTSRPAPPGVEARFPKWPGPGRFWHGGAWTCRNDGCFAENPPPQTHSQSPRQKNRFGENCVLSADRLDWWKRGLLGRAGN